MLSGNGEITRLNSDVTTTMHELGCCIKSGFACSNIREQPLSIRQAVYNMLKHDWTILLFYQSCSIILTVLLHGCWANTQTPAITSLLSTSTAKKSMKMKFSADKIYYNFCQQNPKITNIENPPQTRYMHFKTKFKPICQGGLRNSEGFCSVFVHDEWTVCLVVLKTLN